MPYTRDRPDLESAECGGEIQRKTDGRWLNRSERHRKTSQHYINSQSVLPGDTMCTLKVCICMCISMHVYAYAHAYAYALAYAHMSE